MQSEKASWRKQIKAEVARMRKEQQANWAVGGKGSPGKGKSVCQSTRWGGGGGMDRQKAHFPPSHWEGRWGGLRPPRPLGSFRDPTSSSRPELAEDPVFQGKPASALDQERSLARPSVPQLKSFLPSCPGQSRGGHIPLLQRAGFRGERAYREVPSPPPPPCLLILQ